MIELLFFGVSAPFLPFSVNMDLHLFINSTLYYCNFADSWF
jgi:hypothetical protein